MLIFIPVALAYFIVIGNGLLNYIIQLILLVQAEFRRDPVFVNIKAGIVMRYCLHTGQPYLSAILEDHAGNCFTGIEVMHIFTGGYINTVHLSPRYHPALFATLLRIVLFDVFNKIFQGHQRSAERIIRRSFEISCLCLQQQPWYFACGLSSSKRSCSSSFCFCCNSVSRHSFFSFSSPVLSFAGWRKVKWQTVQKSYPQGWLHCFLVCLSLTSLSLTAISFFLWLHNKSAGHSEMQQSFCWFLVLQQTTLRLLIRLLWLPWRLSILDL